MSEKFNEKVVTLSVKHPERRLFDSLVYMPEGTSYNSYLIKGEKYNALVDCSDPDKEDEFMLNLSEADTAKIDYIILLHAEQDHSGSIHKVMNKYPDAKIISTEKVKQLMQVHFVLNDSDFVVMKQNEKLDLGGTTLEFYPIPFAHWPDNTMIHMMPDNILFSSDLFGSHNTTYLMAEDITPPLYKSARSYFSEIMMPFRKNIAKHVKTVREINPSIIATAHGPVWNSPDKIIDLYDKWTSDDVRPFVTIPYVSMHNSTRTAVEYFAERLRSNGLEVKVRDLADKPESLMIQTGELIYDIVDAAGVVFAFPTVLGGPHPVILYTAMTANAMAPKTPVLGMICSYAWASKATDTVNALTGSFKNERMNPLMIKGLPVGEDFKKLEEYADELSNLIFSRS